MTKGLSKLQSMRLVAGGGVQRFHYENRQFCFVLCHTNHSIGDVPRNDGRRPDYCVYLALRTQTHARQTRSLSRTLLHQNETRMFSLYFYVGWLLFEWKMQTRFLSHFVFVLQLSFFSPLKCLTAFTFLLLGFLNTSSE